MEWRFWRRNHNADGSGAGASKKLPGPKDMPQQVGQYLVLHEKMDPDYVWHLKCVVLPRAGKKTLFDYRIYSRNAAQRAGVNVVNYHSLDNYPELILYTGHYDKKHFDFDIQPGRPPAAA